MEPAQAYSVSTYLLGDTYDGYIKQENAVYGTARNASTGSTPQTIVNRFYVGQGDDGDGTFDVWRAFLFFDTSSIPDDATINNATLSLYLYGDQSDTDFNLTIQTGTSIRPHHPLEQGDYDYLYYSGDGGQTNSSTLSAGFNNITFTSTGLTWIDVDGRTDLVLRGSNDINNIEPTAPNDEYVLFYAREGGSSYAPRLYIDYIVGGGTYDFHGAFDEDGIRDGAINCTVFRQSESSVTFELDGDYQLTTADIPIAAYFDIGNNESRVYYFYQSYEEVYVINPTDPYDTYLFTVVDMVGTEWAYLETLLVINGTDTIVERWDIKAVQEMPFTLSWGVTYKLRIVCNLGTYYYSSFVAGASYGTLLSITSDMFPVTFVTTEPLTVTGQRMNGTWLRAYYYDSEQETNWIYVAFYAYGDSTPTLYTNQSTYTITYNWYAADNATDFWILITSNHNNLGTISWTFSAPAPYDSTNPWSGMDIVLGSGFPISASQFLGVGLVLLVFSVFSQANVGIGVIVGIILAAVLTLIGFLSIGWAWLATSMAVGVIVALSIHKDRERNI